ncbi:MAG: hypothetical protein VB093_05015, partial [Propionicimonas sp.]|nr:hypothetical protein [Propionicimonas sp.]
GPDGQTGQTGQGGFDTSALVAALAEGLNLDQTTVQTAVDDAVAALSSQPGEPPSGGQPPDGQASGGPAAPDSQASGAPAAPSGESAQGDAGPGASGGEGGQGGPGGNSQLAEQLAGSIATALGVDESQVLTIVQANLPAMGGPGGQAAPSGAADAPSPQPTTSA